MKPGFLQKAFLTLVVSSFGSILQAGHEIGGLEAPRAVVVDLPLPLPATDFVDRLLQKAGAGVANRDIVMLATSPDSWERRIYCLEYKEISLAFQSFADISGMLDQAGIAGARMRQEIDCVDVALLWHPAN